MERVTTRSAQDAAIALAAVAALLAADLPSIGADGWRFTARHVHAEGPLGWMVGLARGHWDVNLLRTTVVATLALVVLAGLLVLRGWRPGRRMLVALTMAAVAGALFPPVLLQMGLRQSTAPWFYTNDSTYQIELAGSVARHGHSPYGHDYRYSGMERFYTLDGRQAPHTDRMVQLRHFPYFPGSAAAAAVWDELPAPWRDYRLFIALCTLLLVPAALLFPGPLGCRLALGAALACNPVALRLAWFGNGDAPCVLAIVTAFGLAGRGRYRSAGAALAVAVLFKQFALAAVPALLVLIALRASSRVALSTAATGAAVLGVAFAPFLIASPTDVWNDTVAFGTGSFHIASYGMSGVLARFGIVGKNAADYPALALMLVVWLPVTAYAALLQWRSRAAWTAGVSFTVSVFVLLLVARVFQESYILYPLTGVILTMLLALERLEISLRAERPATIELAPASAPEPVAMPVLHSQAS
jgi:hypothetical protein